MGGRSYWRVADRLCRLELAGGKTLTGGAGKLTGKPPAGVHRETRRGLTEQVSHKLLVPLATRSPESKAH